MRESETVPQMSLSMSMSMRVKLDWNMDCLVAWVKKLRKVKFTQDSNFFYFTYVILKAIV